MLSLSPDQQNTQQNAHNDTQHGVVVLYAILHAASAVCLSRPYASDISRAARDDLNNLDGELLVAWADDRLVLLTLRLEVSTWRVDDCARIRQEERGTKDRSGNG